MDKGGQKRRNKDEKATKKQNKRDDKATFKNCEYTGKLQMQKQDLFSKISRWRHNFLGGDKEINFYWRFAMLMLPLKYLQDF